MEDSKMDGWKGKEHFQTNVFSNLEFEPEIIQMEKMRINPLMKLQISGRTKILHPHIGPWAWGFHPIMSSFSEMKQFAIEKGTWEDEKEVPKETDLEVKVQF